MIMLANILEKNTFCIHLKMREWWHQKIGPVHSWKMLAKFPDLALTARGPSLDVRF